MVKISPPPPESCMHIAFIEDTELYGGTQLWVIDAIRFFLDQKWKITVITPKNGRIADECKKICTLQNLVLYDYLDISINSERYMKLWGEALQHCKVAICTVHPPRNNYHVSIFSAKCIQAMGIPTILLTKTGTIVPSYIRQYYLPDQLSNSGVIAITKTIFQSLITNYNIPEKKIRQIYQGIDLRYFKKRKPKNMLLESRLSEATPILGCFGSLEHRKGQEVLLKAIENIKIDHLPKIHLLIVGDGPDETKLKKMVKKRNIEMNVTFIPFTPDPADYYVICDFVILPSITKEGLPNVLLEALALSIPVISSNIGGIAEIVKDGYTGYLVNPENVDHLVNAILRMESDPISRKKMGIHGQKLVLDHHNRERQMTKFKEYIKSII